MKKPVKRSFEAELVDFLIEKYFSGDVALFASAVKYQKQQIEGWRKGTHKPRASSLKYMLSATVAPEFKVLAEFIPVNFSKTGDVTQKLTAALSGHDTKVGIYAFYDSMCNVIYVGKASTGLLREMRQQLTNKLDIKFPKAVSKAPLYRWEVVRYVSAYEIPAVEHLDYPKHVESLVLRISKPVGNKVLGRLNFVSPPNE